LDPPPPIIIFEFGGAEGDLNSLFEEDVNLKLILGEGGGEEEGELFRELPKKLLFASKSSYIGGKSINSSLRGKSLERVDAICKIVSPFPTSTNRVESATTHLNAFVALVNMM